MLHEGRESMGDGDCGGGMGSNDMYNESVELVLVSLSNSYSDDERILSR